MFSFWKSRWRSIRCALQGMKYVLFTQENTWVHALISGAVLALGLWLSLTRIEWVVILFTMALVWVTEILNTVFEILIDIINPQPHPTIRIAKDVSAAAVLLTAFVSIMIGLLILGPPLWARVLSWFGY